MSMGYDIGASQSIANSSSAANNSPFQVTGGGKNQTSLVSILVIGALVIALGFVGYLILSRRSPAS